MIKNYKHRKEYRGAKAIDPTCRNHGSDYYSAKGRQHNTKKHTPFPFTEDEIGYMLNIIKINTHFAE